MENEHDELIRRLALDLGFSLVGAADIASIRGDFLLPAKLAARFSRAVALAKRLSDDVLEEIEDRPTPLYFHHYRQTNYLLDRGTTRIADFIQDQGFHALAVPASQLIDWANQRAHVSHKAVARLAGLGWIGRNNLLVTPAWGARVRLATVLTDLPLSLGKPVEFGCGLCRRCLAPCPAGAIHEDPAAFDHRGCYEKLDEFRRQHVVSQHICGVCVKACRGPAGI